MSQRSEWRPRRSRFGLTLAGLALAALVLGGCDDGEVYTGDAPPPGQGGPAPQATGKPKGAKGQAAADESKLPSITFTDADFVESEQARDPFRDFRHLFAKRADGGQTIQRRVKAPQYALDELKLQAIIARRIMLTDPTGHGWIVYSGEYVGKPEIVRSAGTDGAEVAINWRVDRIRDRDVVFIREDAAHPEIPPTTRVVPLYPVGEGS